MKLSIIIVTYRSIDVIGQCLESLIKYNDLEESFEVIIVDNSPESDPMYEYIKQKYIWVKIVKNPQNGGFGQGNNIGCNLAQGDYLLFLNPDTILVEPICSFAVKQFEVDKELAILGIRLIYPNNKNALSFRYYPEYYSFFRAVLLRILDKINIFTSKTMFTTGACMFVHKDRFIEAGMFDERIFMYCEEADLCKRISKLEISYRIKFSPDKRIIHLEGYGSNEADETHIWRYEQLVKSTLYYLYKNGRDDIGYINHNIIDKQIKRIYYYIRRNKNGISIMNDQLVFLNKIKREVTMKLER